MHCPPLTHHAPRDPPMTTKGGFQPPPHDRAAPSQQPVIPVKTRPLNNSLSSPRWICSGRKGCCLGPFRGGPDLATLAVGVQTG